MKQTLCLLLPMLLAACSLAPPSDPQSAWEKQQNDLTNLQSWTFRSPLLLEKGPRRGRIFLQWQQQGRHYDILLRDIIGRTVAHLSGSDEGAQLQLPARPLLHGQDGEQLLAQTLGWPLPLRQLSYWLKGLPSQDSDFSLDAYGKLATAQSENWRFTVLSYQNYQHLALPVRALVQGPHAHLRIGPGKWQFSSIPEPTS